MGAMAGHGRLTKFVTQWVHRLGSLARQSFIFVQDSEYLRESMPQSHHDHGMSDCTHAGDGTVIHTETPRRGIFKQLKNALYDSKTGASGALGEHLCSANGHNAIASQLQTGRTSEINALHTPEIQDGMRAIPTEDSTVYDKGVRGRFEPNNNFRYCPNFLAPARGKTKFTGKEAGENKAIAVNRYVVEICYTRVKDWRILGGIADREDFHLLNSAWLWALGFGNIALGMLRPPPDVPNGVPSLCHYSEWLEKHPDNWVS